MDTAAGEPNVVFPGAAEVLWQGVGVRGCWIVGTDFDADKPLALRSRARERLIDGTGSRNAKTGGCLLIVTGFGTQKVLFSLAGPGCGARPRSIGSTDPSVVQRLPPRTGGHFRETGEASEEMLLLCPTRSSGGRLVDGEDMGSWQGGQAFRTQERFFVSPGCTKGKSLTRSLRSPCYSITVARRAMMDQHSPAEKQADTAKSAAVTMATVSGSSTCAQAPSTSLSITPPDRQTVQVIQHAAIHRPQTIAAQYLHQMYAAQQQHFMLQTAALQQHPHPSHLQSLATLQQATVSQKASPSSSNNSLVQAAAISQNSLTLPVCPVTAQLIGQTQSSSAGAATSISQQAVLVGNRPPNCNQAQMYLRTQMLILTPAATVAAVQSDHPTVTSCSSLPTSSQTLALRAHLPSTLATAHGIFLKPLSHTQNLSASLSNTANPLIDSPADAGQPDVTQINSGPQIITPAYPPVHTHTLVKQQLSTPTGQQVVNHHFILQRTSAGAQSHRQLQPFTFREASLDTSTNPLPLSVKSLASPTTSQSQKMNTSSSSPSQSPSVTSVFVSSAQTSAVTVQPHPPPLVAAPQHRTLFPQDNPPPPPPPLVLPRLPQNAPASLHGLSLHSIQALAIHSGRALLTEQELPVAEALTQMPYQNLLPPQTVAVDLKVHPVRQNKTSPLEPTCKVNGVSSEERAESPTSQKDTISATPVVSSKQNGAAVVSSSSVTSTHSMIRSPQVEDSSQLTSTANRGSNPPAPPPPAPSQHTPLSPPITPAPVRAPSQSPSAPASLPGSPDRTAHILTHLIEGFIIREGLEPFPAGSSSLTAEHQASLPEPQEIQSNGDVAVEDSPVDADLSDSTDSEMENDGPAADGSSEVAELEESVAGVLQCECCGRRGSTHTFLHSRRFCSMTCVRRFGVSCTKRVTVLQAARWGHRLMVRRGRPSRRANREHFHRQPHRSFGSEDTQQSSQRQTDKQLENEEEKDEEPPVPMTTRLRKQAERQREREQAQRTTEMITVSDEEHVSCPSHWNVEQVFSYISTLPGGADMAEEFRSQEIDGQALLLLTEDHLVSTMNLKLGPALKICAHINSLKDA
ncbi:polyhomeotic-like protein 3 [Pholidichthys leucotaenia]